jgi:hypothetical protein
MELTERMDIINSILVNATDYSISDDLEALKKYEPKYPEAPRKPILDKKHTSEEALSYANSLVEYEQKMKIHKALVFKFGEANYDYHSMIKDLIIKKTDLAIVPSQYIQKLWDVAYETKHSYGYHEVYYFLLTLKSIFDVTHK